MMPDSSLYPFSLKPYHTFRTDAWARLLVEANSEQAIADLARKHTGSPLLVLGQGSNVLFRTYVDTPVLVNRIMGKGMERLEGGTIRVWAGAGEPWHDLVVWTLNRQAYGLENLSLIPGTVGAAPVQNIGAYGVELNDVFESLEAIDLTTGAKHMFSLEDCRFGYRDSVFKKEYKDRYAITRVLVRLNADPVLCLEYGAIRETLAGMGVSQPTPEDVSAAVIRIRSEKLPDPLVLGNAGSFFKNPEVSGDDWERIRSEFPNLPRYASEPGRFKIPAGWLIEQCGWKGRRVGKVGCYSYQALVLVNYGGATGEEIWSFAESIQDSVWSRFRILLEPEVRLV